MRARLADSVGASDQAVRSYAAALALAPQNETLAARALDQGLAAGNRPLALSAARALDKTGKLKVDGRLLLLSEALRTRDWRVARLQTDRIEEDEVFAFLAPLLRAWIAQGSGKGDPLALLANLKDNPLAAAYADEQKALLLLAGGRSDQGVAALLRELDDAGARAPRLRIAAAGQLVRKGDRKGAMALLEGDSEALAAARATLAAGGKLSGEIGSPAAGIAELFVRIALDLNSQDVPTLALDFARLATFMAPENSETWIVTSELLAGSEQHDAALVALDKVPAGDPFAGSAANTRIDLLVAAGRTEEALVRARAETGAKPDSSPAWARLGDLLSRLKRPGEAADAYGKSLALVRSSGPGSETREWPVLLLQGSALVEAGRWAEGKSALQASYKLAPEQAIVLNYLGYSQLERRENVAEAERLIREASRLQPDNAAITDSLGWAHYLRGDFAKAIELLERASRGQPADAAINEHLGDAYFKAGRRFEARYAWQAALVHAEGSVATRLRSKVDGGLTAETAAP
ncbi:MAG TPA: tetratricopeptide repeat protein [Allosphingosinicella sp.]|nr:tetratricopeptide repeat protein [Allosphingosinicella sp.]